MLFKFKRYFVDWRNQLVMSQKFQKWAGNTPIIRIIARKEGEKIYDLMAGFVYSQTLLAMVELNIFYILNGGALSAEDLSSRVGVSKPNISMLCRSATAIGILETVGDDEYALSRLGASVLGVPGLIEMIRHHRLFYEDLADPVGLLKNKIETHMSKYWPYVLNDERQGYVEPKVAAIYSDLMRSSQKLVSEETLRLISFSSTKRLLDIGGGTGAFIEEVSKVASGASFCLFDLPEVAEKAKALPFFQNEDSQFEILGGNFLVDDIPEGFDTITLIRVLYDHNDDVVSPLLRKVYEALPEGGRVIISEPMSGDKKPIRSGDSYFGFYTTAMSTGRPRSPKEHTYFLKEAGFKVVKKHRGTREFVTQVITAHK